MPSSSDYAAYAEGDRYQAQLAAFFAAIGHTSAEPDVTVLNRWADVMDTFAKPPPPPPPPRYRREHLGFNREAADAAALDRMCALAGGPCWWRDSPEHPTTTSMTTAWKPARDRHMFVLATGLTATFDTSGRHVLPDVSTSTGKALWQNHVKGVLAGHPDAWTTYNEPNINDFSGGKPDPTMTARMVVIAFEVATSMGYPGAIIGPSLAARGDARTDPFAPINFWHAMVKAVPEVVHCVPGGVDMHTYSYMNNGMISGPSASPEYWNAATQCDEIAAEVAKATGAPCPIWWSETGAPAIAPKGAFGTYVGSDAAQALQLADKFSGWNIRRASGRATGALFVHCDLDNFSYDKSRGVDFGIVANDASATWRLAATAFHNEAIQVV